MSGKRQSTTPAKKKKTCDKENNEGKQGNLDVWLEKIKQNKSENPQPRHEITHLKEPMMGVLNQKPDNVSNLKKESGDPSKPVFSFKWANRNIRGGQIISKQESDPLIDGLKVSKKFLKKYNALWYLRIHASKLDAMVNPHVPLGALPEGEQFELCQRKIKLPKFPNYTEASDGILFRVANKGQTEGGAVRTILHHDLYCPGDKKLGVFGYKNQTIKGAILADGRFKIGSDSGFILKGGKGEEEYENHMQLSCLKDNYKQYTYTIVFPPGEHCKPPGEHHSVIDDQESQENMISYTPLPQSQSRYEEFTNNFKQCYKKKKSWEIVKENFSNYITSKPITLASTHRLLTQHLDSVGLIMYKDSDTITGTCFLLTESLVITCNHVVRDILKDTDSIQNSHIIFNYESDADKQICYPVINEITSNIELDYSILQLGNLPGETPPRGLLEYLELPPANGAVSIIGHPENQFKMIDLCSVISYGSRNSQFLHLATKHTFPEIRDPNLVTYNTCFYSGSSGSPVFNAFGKLVAMHTGGYVVHLFNKKTSIIEYGRSLFEVIVCAAGEIKELRSAFKELAERNEDLKRKIHDLPKHALYLQPIIRRLLQLWESETDLIPTCDNSQTSMDTD
ncbi:serine protease FAM111A-like [Pelobates fuscus]|uniref:serine protease FAM111A-like n=1 Tax=Pelobates fuscus TaxID=191477 RepID=UPI002FE49198